VDLDFAEVAGAEPAPGAPLVLLLHGLEGSARRPSACSLYRELAWRGVRAAGMNFRSCSGEMNRLARFYHAGATDDVAFVHDWLDTRAPGVPKGMIGFSLGGNMLLKYLGEGGSSLGERLRAAAAVSAPFDLTLGARHLQEGLGPLYARSFLRHLKHKVRLKAALIGDRVDVDRALAATTLVDFDDACTAPLHGFRDAHDYYTRCSSAQYLGTIQTPTLVLRALDDPIIPRADVPHDLLAANPSLYPWLTEQGGHVGWCECALSGRRSFWAERQAARFLAERLLAGP
jgi:predicted alpha/beta-fold hydrolase